MFFKSKQKKLDPKVRFQHHSFTDKVRAAQSYKRQAQRVPETEQERILASFGLESRWSRALVVLGILGLIYLVYIPNFMSVRRINITGTSDGPKQQLEQTIKNYFSDSPFYAAQRNAVFLNLDDLREYIYAHDKDVWKIHDLKKDLGKVDIQVSFKRERFLLVTPTSEYVLYNDGTVVGPRDPANQNQLVRIQTADTNSVYAGKQYLSGQMLGLMELIRDNLERTTTLPVDYFELPVTTTENKDDNETQLSSGPLSVLIPNELVVHVKESPTVKHVKPFKIYFDASSDTNKALQNLAALIKHMNPPQVMNLYYIDMRFPERGFSCAKQAPCSIEKSLVPEESERVFEGL